MNREMTDEEVDKILKKDFIEDRIKLWQEENDIELTQEQFESLRNRMEEVGLSFVFKSVRVARTLCIITLSLLAVVVIAEIFVG